MHTITWSVRALTSPKIIRHCNKCSRNRFISSGRFRVNANRNHIDAWLIYKCEHCDASLNIEVISRKSVSRIDPLLYKKLTDNDAKLAQSIALDRALLCGSGTEIDYDAMVFEVEGDLPQEGAKTQIIMIPNMPLYVPVSRLISQRLGISQSALRRMAERQMFKRDADLKQRLIRSVEFVLEDGWSKP